MGYWALGHEGERDIVLVKEKKKKANVFINSSKREAAAIVFVYKAGDFATSRLWLIAY